MRILITGGTGTVGTAFMREFGDKHEFAVLSRNEMLQWAVKKEFPRTHCFLGGVESLDRVLRAYHMFQPAVVIHAAAVKHIDMAEQQPIQTCKVNVLGSLNVIEASTLMQTPTTIAISTDKACSASVYGASKFLMERAFLEADTARAKFAVCRFGNVAKSNGSVIPKWLAAAAKGEPLEVTSPTMCRMMISQPDAAKLIQLAIELAQFRGKFVLLKKLKQVNVLALAKQISDNVVVVGPRPGEKQYETLLTEAEIPYSYVDDHGYVMLRPEMNMDLATRFGGGYSSQSAEEMTDTEIRDLIYA